MARASPLLEHLHRRAGFGLTAADAERVSTLRSYRDAVDELLVFDPADADVDALIGTPGYVGITSSGPFLPSRDINHARQRWLFRLVHARAPLREKMALFWHHHFATAFSKIAGVYGSTDAARLMAATPGDDPAGQRGQIETLRLLALDRFSSLLVAIAADPAMLVWLDGRTNVKARPQENFGRELMELFTFGVDHYVETDVYAAARVFTGWNLRVRGQVNAGTASYEFVFDPAQHDTDPKDFSFPIYARGASSPYRIPARAASDGFQDGLDLIHALAFHPETARRLARRLWTWFVSETSAAPDDFVQAVARTYLDQDTSIRAVLRTVLTSPYFEDASAFYQRYAWPVEFVVRSLREVGYLGFSVGDALTPLLAMGQQLYEPPDVNGWEAGPGWFSTGGMLARMNFASQLATNQRVALRAPARAFNGSPQALVDFAYQQLSAPAAAPEVSSALLTYLESGAPWTGSDTQLLAKTAGLFHLIGASADYQFV
jgi:uncharacterized protein (DUF1800 family)